MSGVEVAIVGAGPYGISLAAHLSHQGVPARIFGEPMWAWRAMPRNLFLKSLGFATSIPVPESGHEFPRWLGARGLETLEPISYADFVDYGLEIQQRFVPGVEQVKITEIRQEGTGFALTTAAGEQVAARSVVVAVGLGYFTRLPEVLAALPPTLVSHTFRNYDFRHLAGREVAVIGVGSSALEAAVCLQEAGARTTLFSRKPPIYYDKTPLERPLLQRFRSPLTVFGAGGQLHWFIQNWPWLPRWLPEARRVRFSIGFNGPAGTWWVEERLAGKVEMRHGTTIAGAREVGGKVALNIQGTEGRTERCFDHVVCGTGYAHDIARLPFLHPALVKQLRLIQGRAPQLSPTFEASVPRLSFIGPFATYACGPSNRFVCGASYAIPKVAQNLVRRHRRGRGPVPTEPARPARAA